ncbi:glutathione S-transferase, partial [Klebsiella pneumoniae]
RPSMALTVCGLPRRRSARKGKSGWIGPTAPSHPPIARY